MPRILGSIRIDDIYKITEGSGINLHNDVLIIGPSGYDAVSDISTLNIGDTNTFLRATYNDSLNLGSTQIIFTSSGSESVRINSSGSVGIGTNAPSQRFHLYGTDANVLSGPHMWFQTTFDAYPQLQILPYNHDNVSINFDAFFDGTWRSADAGSNFSITKFTDLLQFQYDSGVAAGLPLGWNLGFCMNTSGHIGIGTTNPISKLDVRDGILSISGPGSGIQLRDTADNPVFQIVTDRQVPRETMIVNNWDASSNPGVAVGTIRTDGYAFQVVNGVTVDGTGLPVTDGNPIMVVQGDGNVGIGITNPSALLDINGDLNVGTTLTTTSLTMTTGAVDGYIMRTDGSGNATWVDINTVSSQSRIEDTDENTFIDTELNPDENIIRFYTAGSERMIIGSTGYVGIGTDTPIGKLQVESTAAAQMKGFRNICTNMTAGQQLLQFIGKDETTRNGVWNWYSHQGDASLNNYLTWDFNGASNTLVIKATGSVGIGTTNPTEKLYIAANSTTTIEGIAVSQDGTVSNGLRLLVGGTSYATTGGFIADAAMLSSEANLSAGLSLITRNASAPIRFYTGGHTNERMRITETGNVGIGTNAPARTFHLQGSNTLIRIDRDADAPGIQIHRFPTGNFTTPWKGFVMGVEASGSNNGSFFINDYGTATTGASTERFRIDNDGNVGIGTNDPQQILDVASGVSGCIQIRDSSATFAPQIHLLRGDSTRWGTSAFADWKIGAADNNALDFIFESKWNAGGVEAMRLNYDNGYVGIGTNNPLHMLHINGANASATAGPRVNLTTSSGTSPTLQLYSYSQSFGGLMWSSQWNSGWKSSSTSGNFQIYKSDLTTYSVLQINAAYNIADGADITWTNGLTVKSNGNIGIGTAGGNPNYPLSFGNSLANTKLAIWDGGAGTSYGIGVQNNQFRFNVNNTPDRFSFLNSEAGTEIMTIKGTGEVGIGTTNPTTSKLVIEGAENALHICHGDVNTSETRLYLGGSSFNNQIKTAIIADPTGTWGRSRLMFCTNTVGDASNVSSADAKMTITNAGDVGIGIITPTEKLDVNGNLLVRGDFTVNGDTFTINSESIEIEDTMIALGITNNLYDTLDIGFYGMYNNGGVKYSGLVRDASDSGTWHLFESTVEPGTTFTLSNHANLHLNNLEVDGNVGVGTATPAYVVDIVNVSPYLQLRTAGGADGRVYFGNSSHGVGRNTTRAGFAGGNDVALWTTTGNVGLSVDNSRYLVLNQSGFVGFNTAPDSAFHLAFTTGNTIDSTPNSDGIRMGFNGSSDRPALEFSGANDAIIDFNRGDGVDSLGRIYYNMGSDYMAFFTNNGLGAGERMRIDTSGNVGIGTATPAAGFHSHQNVNILGTFGGSSLIINDIGTAKWRLSTGGSALTFSKHTNVSNEDYVSWSTKVTFDPNGYVGINNGAPDNMLHIFNTNQQVDLTASDELGLDFTADLIIERRHGNTLDPIYGYTGPSLDFRIYNGTERASVATIVGVADPFNGTTYDGGLAFFTSPGGSVNPNDSRTQGGNPLPALLLGQDQRAYFAGNVGIGTTSPQAKLDVAGSTKIGGNLRTTVTSISSGTTLDHTHSVVVCDASLGGFIVFLPVSHDGTAEPNFKGSVFHIIKVDASVNAVTVSISGSDVLDGSTSSIILTNQDDHVTVLNAGGASSVGRWYSI